MIYVFIVFILFFAINLLAGAIFSGYERFNLVFTSVVLLVNLAFLCTLCKNFLKDAFKISLTFLFVVSGVVEFVLAALSPAVFSDNVYVMSVATIVAIQLLLLVITYLFSIKNS